MKINKLITRRRGFSLVELLVVIAIIATLAALSMPAITSATKRAALTKSVSNARQMRIALEDFAIDFDGEFVNETNAAQISDSGNVTFSDASDAFQTLLDSGSLGNASEELFYTKELKNEASLGHSQGDEDGTLTDDECGYSYVTDLSNTSPGSAPVITTKLKSAAGEFYTSVWGHKAVIARVDNSAKAERLSGKGGEDAEDGNVRESIGGTQKNVFDWATEEASGTVLQ